MRIYSNPVEAVQEIQRDLYEMGVKVHPETMQDRVVKDDPDYMTLELQEYAFKIVGWDHNRAAEQEAINYCITGQIEKSSEEYMDALYYIDEEFRDRIAANPTNPGNSWRTRRKVWEQFLHDGKFAYTYSERLCPQWNRFFEELSERPSTRQAILNLHSNICPVRKLMERGSNPIETSMDQINMGGSGRIPCSLYYQAINRNGKLHWIYGMRSCDFIVHFAVDIFLAMRLQKWTAERLGLEPGPFTYFTGSLHAYHKDLKTRGIF